MSSLRQEVSLSAATVGGILVKDGQVLLGLRHPNRASFPNTWDIPGGHIEPGESPRAALRRELQEELGIDAVIEGSWHHLLDDALGIDLLVAVVHQWKGEIRNKAPNEHQQLQWFAVAGLASLDLPHPSYVPLLSEVLAGAEA